MNVKHARLEIDTNTGRSLAGLKNISDAHRAEMLRLVECVENHELPGAWACLDFTMPSKCTYRVVLRKPTLDTDAARVH